MFAEEMKILKSIRSNDGSVFSGLFYDESREVVATDGVLMGISKTPILFIESLVGKIFEPDRLCLIEGGYAEYKEIVGKAEKENVKKYLFSFPLHEKLPNCPVYLYDKGEDGLLISLDYEGEVNFVTKVDGKYLNKLFIKLGKKICTLDIYVSEANRPLIIRIEDFENLTIALMPMDL